MGILQSNRTTPNTVASLIGMAAALIPYTKNVTNVGATGTKIAISGKSNGNSVGKPLVLSKFADDRPPIRLDDVTKRGISISTSGKVTKWSVVPKIRVSLSLIPCTQDDCNMGYLADICDEFQIDIYQVRQSAAAASISVLGIGAAECMKYGINLYGGTLISCPPCGGWGQPQGSAEQSGRWSGHTYEFLFTDWTMIEKKAAAPGFWSSLIGEFG